MATDIVTGKRGFEHISSDKIGAHHAAIIGPGDYVLEGGSQYEHTLLSPNSLHIGSGETSMQGRHFRTDEEGETLTIESGTQGQKRFDIAVQAYSRSGDIEEPIWLVKKGVPSTSPTDPEVTSGDILAGADYHEMAMYRITLDGVSVTKVTPIFKTIPSQKTAWDSISPVVLFEGNTTGNFNLRQNPAVFKRLVICGFVNTEGDGRFTVMLENFMGAANNIGLSYAPTSALVRICACTISPSSNNPYTVTVDRGSWWDAANGNYDANLIHITKVVGYR